MYKMVNLLKSYDNVPVMTYRIKIMLSGISIINTGYTMIQMITTENKIKMTIVKCVK